MSILLVLIAVLPLLTALAALVVRPALAAGASVVVGVACLGLACGLVAGPPEPVEVGLLRADALSAVFVLATAFVYAAAAVYAVGYLRGEHDGGEPLRYRRRFWVGLNLFAWSRRALGGAHADLGHAVGLAAGGELLRRARGEEARCWR